MLEKNKSFSHFHFYVPTTSQILKPQKHKLTMIIDSQTMVEISPKTCNLLL